MTAEERETLKSLIDQRTRESFTSSGDYTITGAKRPSNNPNGKQSFLTEDDVQRLYCMYQATSLNYVARLVWKHYGYASQHSCKERLRVAFKRRGLPLYKQGCEADARRRIEQYEKEAA